MIYYEMSKEVADHYYNGVQYWTASEAPSPKSWVSAMQQYHAGHQARLLQHSNRAWQEKDDTVTFIKNRYTGLMTPVDMREFFLVKIRARSP